MVDVESQFTFGNVKGATHKAAPALPLARAPKSYHQFMTGDQNNENTRKCYIRGKGGSTGVKEELQGAKLDEVGFIQKCKNRVIFIRTLLVGFYPDVEPGVPNSQFPCRRRTRP